MSWDHLYDNHQTSDTIKINKQIKDKDENG
jgi:hypothetical protein